MERRHRIVPRRRLSDDERDGNYYGVRSTLAAIGLAIY